MAAKLFFAISFSSFILLNSCGLPTDDPLWMREQTIAVDKISAEKCIIFTAQKINTFNVTESKTTLYGLVFKIEGSKSHPKLDLKVWAPDENHVQILFTGRGLKEPEDIKNIIDSHLKKISAVIINSCS